MIKYVPSHDDKQLVATYVYDAWGNHKVLNPDGTENTDSSFIGNKNPIRYRSYYYDVETGLYYLHSRYYDPRTGRFISPDSTDYLDPSMISGMNLYAYCNNNPVSFIDPSGKFIISALLLAGVIITSSIILKSDSVYDSGIKKMEEDAVMLATENYHSDVLDAVEAWGEENSKASIIDKRERGAFIYSKEISGKKYYYIGKTRTGYETTCWNAFIFGYLFREGKIEGFIHTHTPYPNKNGTWNYKDYGPSDADMFLFKIPGVKQQYIANSLGEIYMFDEDGDKYFLDYSN